MSRPTGPARGRGRALPAGPSGFAAALADRVLVLDGGLSRQLAAEGADLSGDLWTARLLAEDPDRLVAAHAAFARAGARVLITGSYQASFEGFARHGIGPAGAARLFADATRLAREGARQAAGAGDAAWIAGSIGPYGAVRADGGEYRGRYGLSVAELTRFHRPRVEAVAAGAPDVLALETVPDTDEAEALLRAAEGTGLPVWLSYTVADGRTRAGQSLEDAFALAARHPRVVAVGVNCCAPNEVAGAIRRAVAATGLPAVAYPNSGERWDGRRWGGEVAFDASAAADWAAAGARLIGGCCRVGTAEIAGLAAALGGRSGAPRSR